MYSDVYELVGTTSDRELLLEEIDILINSLYKTEVRNTTAVVLDKYKDKLAEVRQAVQRMREIKLEVARELPQAAIEEISGWVRKHLGEDVVLDFSRRPELIGGATVYWEGRYGDYSLRKKLDDQFLDKQKTRLAASLLTSKHTDVVVLAPSGLNSPRKTSVCQEGVDLRGVEPLLPALTEQIPHRRRPTPHLL